MKKGDQSEARLFECFWGKTLENALDRMGDCPDYIDYNGSGGCELHDLRERGASCCIFDDHSILMS